MSRIFFLSDCHLSEDRPKTNIMFVNFCKKNANQANQIFILGDLFDHWTGNEMLSKSWVQKICKALYELKSKNIQIFFIHGNRDFLIDKYFLKESGLKLLDEVVTINTQDRKIALLHGDILCTKDHCYQWFRWVIRSSLLQFIFKSTPTSIKKNLIKMIRNRSKNRGEKIAQKNKLEKIDATPKAIAKLMQKLDVKIIIHGHTHRHWHHKENETERFVLSDWDLDDKKKRASYLKLEDGKFETIDLLSMEKIPINNSKNKNN